MSAGALDEPMTGLEEAARDRLLRPLRALTRRRTITLISHGPAVVGWADRRDELGSEISTVSIAGTASSKSGATSIERWYGRANG